MDSCLGRAVALVAGRVRGGHAPALASGTLRAGSFRRVAGGVALALVASAALSACGGPSASKKLSLSVTSGPPGTVVNLSGKAGGGCSPGTNWFGFDFERANGKGPLTQMTTPLQKNGSWSATFVVPSFLGSAGSTGVGAPGGPISTGSYEFVAPSCKGHVVAKAAFQVTSAKPSASKASDYIAIVPTVDGEGYWLVRSDGAVSAFGDARGYGSLPAGKAASTGGVVGMARTYDGHGYWLVTADGDVYGFGDAHDYGSLPGVAPLVTNGPVVSMAATPNGKGYWLLSASGHVYGFGDAKVIGMPTSHLAPFDAIVARPAGGYIVTAADDGAVYLYPGNEFVYGGPGNAQATTLVGTAVTPSGNGAWQAGMDGGVTTYGDAQNGFYGSLPGDGITPTAPVTAIAATPDGRGYWLLGARGHIYTFGDAKVFPAAA